MVSNLVGGDAAMIELEQLVAGYDGVAITPPLSGMICPGSLTAIVGLNGCGKSTLLKTLAGFLPPVSGRLRWQGKRPVIGWLAQRHALESQFPLNVQDVVSQGAWPGVSLLRGLVVESQDSYGYEISQTVKIVADIKESTLYPILKKLEKNGYLTTYSQEFQGRKRKYYSITDSGKEQLVYLNKEWISYRDTIDGIIEGRIRN